MRKRTIILLICLLSLGMISCGNDTSSVSSQQASSSSSDISKESSHYTVDLPAHLYPKTAYELTIPKGEYLYPPDVMLSFGEISTEYNEKINSDREPGMPYYGGGEAEIIGEGVEALDGAAIYLFQTPLSEVVYSEEEYVDDIINIYELRYGEKIDRSDISNFVKSALDNYYVIEMEISITGPIENDVVVEEIRFDAIDYVYPVNGLKITTKDIGKNSDYDMVEFTSGPGINQHRSLGEGWNSGGLRITCKAMTSINKVEISSLDDRVVVVNEDNYEEYKSKYDIGKVQSFENITSPDTFDLSVDYVFTNPNKDVDAEVANLLLKFEDTDGEIMYRYVCCPQYDSYEYLLVHYIHEQLNS